MELITPVVRHYDWGSRTAIPDLLGRRRTGEPWAELWFGAHPSGPAAVGARAEPLDRMIAADPAAVLGPAVASRYGRLPFMLKVLAAAAPLSLQVHPSAADAAVGFEREEARGIARDAPQRMFRDRSPKPELICALSRFEALCGFRDPSRTLALLDTLDAPGLDPLRHRLGVLCGAETRDIRDVRDGHDRRDVRDVLAWLLTLDRSTACALAENATEACATSGVDDEWSGHRSAVAELGARHPGDRGVVVALLLNHVVLMPTEALFVPAGCLHVHLGGTAVEVMAASDNVVRAGLTSKHIDLGVLLEIVESATSRPVAQHPEPVDGIATYPTTAAEFCLLRADVNGSSELVAGPAILLCVDGTVRANGVTLTRGAAAFAGATESRIALEGQGTVFCATTGHQR